MGQAKQSLSEDLIKAFTTTYQNLILSSIPDHPLLQRTLGYHHGWNTPDGQPTQAKAGKYIRPLLALLSCGARGGNPDIAQHLAVAIELLHNFSLIHDDVMDVSETRRGRTTVWKLWGVNQAINVGDGAYGLSFQILAETPNVNPRTLVYAQRILSKACVDTVYGQMLDISFESRDHVSPDEYSVMTGLKTGPLLGAALGGGALFAGATWEDAQELCTIGRELGVVFQMQDDLLGIWGKPDQTGKSTSDDLTAKKKSLPIIWALENLSPATRQELETLYQNDAPLPPHITERIRDILTNEGVDEAVSTQTQARYLKMISALEYHYPTASDYRDALFNIVAFIVNRTY